MKNQHKYQPKAYDTSRQNPFDPKLHLAEFEEEKVPLSEKQPQKVIVTSMGDLWGNWTSREWIDYTVSMCINAPWHTYLFLTKNPIRYRNFFQLWDRVPSNFWLGTSLDCETYRHQQIHNLATTRKKHETRLYASVEPLRNSPSKETLHQIKHLNWLIIGAQSRPGNKPPLQPEPEWVKNLVETADNHGLPVFLKNNLDCENLGIERRQEHPASMKK